VTSKETRNAYINFTRKPERKSLVESRSRYESYIKTNFTVCDNRLNLSGSWWGNLMYGNHLEDLGVDVSIKLEGILKRLGGSGLGCSGSGYEKSEACNNGNELSGSGSVKDRNLLPEELLPSQEGRCSMDLFHVAQVRLH
jgi:hypothetical protein